MFRLTMKWKLAALAALAWLSACASAPAQRGGDIAVPATSGTLGPINVGVDGALPLLHTRTEPVLASRLGLGGGESRLSYAASYTVMPGNIFDDTAPAPPPGVAPPPPQQLGQQRFGQNFRLNLPPLAGAPVSLRLTAETHERWTMSGNSSAQQRQLANLAWAPWRVNLNLQWDGGVAPADARFALDCDLRGTLRMPLQPAGALAPRAIQLSGRACQLHGVGPRYSDVTAETWGMAFDWSRRDSETQFLLATIDPAGQNAPEQQVIDPAFELAVRHQRNHGPWSARALVAMRVATEWDLDLRDELTGQYASGSESHWTATASLTRHLPAMSVSADWMHAADPMWFMPQIGQRSNRMNMRLDFSRAVASLMPEVTPQMAVQWNWSQARSRTDAIAGDSLVRLNMAVLW